MQPAVVLVRTKLKIAPRQVFPRSNRQSADDSGTPRARRILQALATRRLKFQSMKLHRGSAVSRPCSRPRFPSRSTQESRAQLPRLASCSNARVLRSRVCPISGKFREKFGDQIACNSGSISSRGTNIVDGADFFRHAFSCGIYQRRLDLFSGEHFFRLPRVPRSIDRSHYGRPISLG